MEEIEEEKKDNISESFLKENKIEEENLKRQLEYNKMLINHQNKIYPEEDNIKNFLSQRHLYDHKKEKKDPLIDIIDKNLQQEYVSEIYYIFKKFIFIIILSIFVFIQTLLILHNYKIYDEVLLSQIFSCFLFFNSFFLIVQLYREALRDIFRNKLFRFFSLILSIFCICLFYYQLMNIYIIYDKINIRKEKCKKNEKYCDDYTVNNVILVLSLIHLFLILCINFFPIMLGYRAIKILFGCDLDVYQKQLSENEKKNKNDEKKDNNKEKTSKNDKEKPKNKNNKKHLKSE